MRNMGPFASIDAGHRPTKFKQPTPNTGGEPHTFGCHLDAAGVSHEENGAELFLECGDTVTDRTGRHTKLIACILEAFVTLGGFKYPQRLKRW